MPANLTQPAPLPGGGNAKPTHLRTKVDVASVVESVRQNRGMLTAAAKQLGISYETIRRYCHRFPAVARAVQDAREEMTDLAEMALWRQIEQGAAWAICFYLKTQGRGRGYVERHEVAGWGSEVVPVRIIEVIRPSPKLDNE